MFTAGLPCREYFFGASGASAACAADGSVFEAAAIGVLAIGCGNFWLVKVVVE